MQTKWWEQNFLLRTGLLCGRRRRELRAFAFASKKLAEIKIIWRKTLPWRNAVPDSGSGAFRRVLSGEQILRSLKWAAFVRNKLTDYKISKWMAKENGFVFHSKHIFVNDLASRKRLSIARVENCIPTSIISRLRGGSEGLRGLQLNFQIRGPDDANTAYCKVGTLRPDFGNGGINI